MSLIIRWHTSKILPSKYKRQIDTHTCLMNVNLNCSEIFYRIEKPATFYFKYFSIAASSAGPRNPIPTIIPSPSIKKLDGMLRTP